MTTETTTEDYVLVNDVIPFSVSTVDDGMRFSEDCPQKRVRNYLEGKSGLVARREGLRGHLAEDYFSEHLETKTKDEILTTVLREVAYAWGANTLEDGQVRVHYTHIDYLLVSDAENGQEINRLYELKSVENLEAWGGVDQKHIRQVQRQLWAMKNASAKLAEDFEAYVVYVHVAAQGLRVIKKARVHLPDDIAARIEAHTIASVDAAQHQDASLAPCTCGGCEDTKKAEIELTDNIRERLEELVARREILLENDVSDELELTAAEATAWLLKTGTKKLEAAGVTLVRVDGTPRLNYQWGAALSAGVLDPDIVSQYRSVEDCMFANGYVDVVEPKSHTRFYPINKD